MGSDTNYEDTRDEDFHRNNHTLREWEEEEKHKKEDYHLKGATVK
jgi:hypothetical protein